MDSKKQYWMDKLMKEMLRRFRYQQIAGDGKNFNAGQRIEAKGMLPVIDERLARFRRNASLDVEANADHNIQG